MSPKWPSSSVMSLGSSAWRRSAVITVPSGFGGTSVRVAFIGFKSFLANGLQPRHELWHAVSELYRASAS
jgi:hypothetical protein